MSDDMGVDIINLIWDYEKCTVALAMNGKTIFKHSTTTMKECEELKKELEKLMPYLTSEKFGED